MATIESLETAACLTSETMRSYLTGTVDDESIQEIELHLAGCSNCERLSRETESQPDSFAASLTGLPDKPSAAIDEQNRDALDAIKRLPTTPAGVDGATALPDSVGHLKSLGYYELISPLGHGGMGVVYRARHRRLEKECAIKILPRTLALHPESYHRFEREIAAAGRLDHPAIARATDAGEDHGVHFLVLELVDGLDLSKILRSHGRLKVADACEIVRQTALGLDYAHGRGIIHRDVKPSNLMLDRAGRVKILDFGLAQFGPWNPEATDLTTVGQLLGTLDYMAPEQASQSAAVDHRADVYSLGATLYALLCGRPPYAATPRLSPLEKLRLMATELPPRVQTLRDDLPEALASFVGDLMDRTVEHRPASAAHVAEQIAQFCAGHDLQALLSCVESAPITAPSEIKCGPVLPQIQIAEVQSPNSKARPTNSSPSPTAHQTPPRQRWPVALAWASFAAFAALGIWLIIETRKGQLVIETDSADVRVKLLTNGKQYDELELHPGTNTTRLFAGRYEIEIASGSDRYTLDKNQITVRRGDTIIAKVTSKPTADNSNLSTANIPSSESPIAKPLTEPSYDGKSFSEWLAVLQFERNPQLAALAANALAKLADDQNVGRIREVIVGMVSKGQARSDDIDPSQAASRTISNLVFQVGLSDSEFDLLVDGLDANDVAKAKSFLDVLSYTARRSLSKSKNTDQLNRFLALSKTLFSDKATPEYRPLAEHVAELLRLNVIWDTRAAFPDDTPDHLIQQIEILLVNSPLLGLDYWLGSKSISYSSSFGNPLRSHIIQTILDVLGKDDSAEILVGQACVALFYLSDELNDDEKRTVLGILDRRLQRVAASQSSFRSWQRLTNNNFLSLRRTDQYFPEYTKELFSAPVRVGVAPGRVEYRNATFDQLSLMLRLAHGYVGEIPTTGITAVRELCRSSFKELAERYRALPKSTNPSQFSTNVTIDRLNGTADSSRGRLVLDPEVVYRSLIFIHAEGVEKELETRQKNLNPAQANPDESATPLPEPESTTAAPTYQGRTLEDWLSGDISFSE